MTGKLARRSGFGGNSSPYVCQKPWDADCVVQCGDRGIVFQKGTMADSLLDPATALKQVVAPTVPHYRTAFFEAFPNRPLECFIRGEGKTVEEAEADAWAQFERVCACPADHTLEASFEKRGYTNGGGFCRTCRQFKGKAFAPWEPCVECRTLTFWSQDAQGAWVCETCDVGLPIARWNDFRVEVTLPEGHPEKAARRLAQEQKRLKE